MVLSFRELTSTFITTVGFLARKSLPTPSPSYGLALPLGSSPWHRGTGHGMRSPLSSTGLGCTAWSAGAGCLPSRSGHPTHTFPRMLWLPFTGHLQQCFVGAGLLQVCTACVPQHASHSFSCAWEVFDIWKLPVLLLESPSWFLPSCMFLVMFCVLFHGCAVFIWNQGFYTRFPWFISSSFICSYNNCP